MVILYLLFVDNSTMSGYCSPWLYSLLVLCCLPSQGEKPTNLITSVQYLPLENQSYFHNLLFQLEDFRDLVLADLYGISPCTIPPIDTLTDVAFQVTFKYWTSHWIFLFCLVLVLLCFKRWTDKSVNQPFSDDPFTPRFPKPLFNQFFMCSSILCWQTFFKPLFICSSILYF